MSTLSSICLSPEAQILLTALRRVICLNQTVEETNPEKIEPINSGKILSLAIQNGVEVYLDDGYHSDEPPEWKKKLRLYLQQKKLYNLSVLGEFLRLQTRFQQKGIPIVGFKGPLLAYQLFGDVSKRSFCDLDLLVQAKDLEAVEHLLQRWGYQLRQTAVKPENGDRYFLNATSGVFIDLHTALTPTYYPVLFNYKQLWENLINIDLQGISVLAFPPEILLILLCVHGTKDNWQQLKWVCDIAQLLNQYPQLDWDTISLYTSDYRVCQALCLGINLCQAIFGCASSVPKTFDLAHRPLQKILIAKILSRQLEQPNRPLSFFENVLFCWVRGHVYPLRRWVEEKVLPNEHDNLFHHRMQSERVDFPSLIYTMLSFLIRPLRLAIKFLKHCLLIKTE